MGNIVETKQFINLSFNRNKSTFPDSNIPDNYMYAERLLPTKAEVPRASYYLLSPETVGQPISQRVTDSLKKTYDFNIKNGHKVLDNNFAQQELDSAEKMVNEDDWSGALFHAAEAHNTGGEEIQAIAEKILEHILQTASCYSNFAPATGENKLNTDMGEITIPACIISPEERNYFSKKFAVQNMKHTNSYHAFSNKH